MDMDTAITWCLTGWSPKIFSHCSCGVLNTLESTGWMIPSWHREVKGEGLKIGAFEFSLGFVEGLEMEDVRKCVNDGLKAQGNWEVDFR